MTGEPYGRGEVDDRIALARRTSGDLDRSVRAYLDADEPDAADRLERDLWDAHHDDVCDTCHVHEGHEPSCPNNRDNEGAY